MVNDAGGIYTLKRCSQSVRDNVHGKQLVVLACKKGRTYLYTFAARSSRHNEWEGAIQSRFPIVKANKESCASSSMRHPANKDQKLVGRTDRI